MRTRPDSSEFPRSDETSEGRSSLGLGATLTTRGVPPETFARDASARVLGPALTAEPALRQYQVGAPAAHVAAFDPLADRVVRVLPPSAYMDASAFPPVMLGGGFGGLGGIYAMTVQPGDPIKIGDELKDTAGGPVTLPKGLTKEEGQKKLETLADYLAEVWSYFTFFCDFTVDGTTIAEDVNVTAAFSEKAAGYHGSATLNQAALQTALNAYFDSKTDIFFNDIDNIEIGLPDPPKDPPGGSGGGTADDKRKDAVKVAVEKIKKKMKGKPPKPPRIKLKKGRIDIKPKDKPKGWKKPQKPEKK